MQPKDLSKGHFYVSIVKSILRAIGCVAAIFMAPSNVVLAVMILSVCLVIAEFLGILEEIV